MLAGECWKSCLEVQMDRETVQALAEADIPAVWRLLREARWVSAEPPPLAIAGHLDHWPGWIARRGWHVEAFLIVDARRYPAVQIHTAAFLDTEAIRAHLANLVEAACVYSRASGALPLVYIGDEPWLLAGLQAFGFECVNHVVFYEKLGMDISEGGNAGATLRPATEKDIPALVALDEAAFDPIWRNNSTVFVAALGEYQTLVALVSEEIVGYEMVTLQGRQGYLARLAVHPRWQGKGIGTQLLAEAIVRLRRQGAQDISLNTQEDNQRAQKLYRRFGFRPSGLRLTVLRERRKSEERDAS